jgi:hypothetical protein
MSTNKTMMPLAQRFSDINIGYHLVFPGDIVTVLQHDVIANSDAVYQIMLSPDGRICLHIDAVIIQTVPLKVKRTGRQETLETEIRFTANYEFSQGYPGIVSPQTNDFSIKGGCKLSDSATTFGMTRVVQDIRPVMTFSENARGGIALESIKLKAQLTYHLAEAPVLVEA